MVRILSAVLTALLLSLGLVGCGSADSDDTARDEYVPLTKANFAKVVSKTSDGDVSVHMAMDMAGSKIEFDMVTEGVKFAVQGTVEEEGETSEVIFVDNRAFVRGDGENKFVELPAAFTKELAKSFNEGTPSTMVSELRKGLKGLTYVGEAKIDGSSHHRYTATLDIKVLAKKLGVPAKQVKKLGKFEYVFWLDADNRMRRVEIKMKGETGTIDLTRWGQEVEVKAPPASQVEAFPGS